MDADTCGGWLENNHRRTTSRLWNVDGFGGGEGRELGFEIARQSLRAGNGS
jgi:hypothetical protein